MILNYVASGVGFVLSLSYFISLFQILMARDWNPHKQHLMLVNSETFLKSLFMKISELFATSMG